MNELLVGAWSMTEAAGAHLAGVSLPLLAAGLVLHTGKLAARARAWQNVLKASFPSRTVHYRDAAVPYFAGIGAGAVVPFGGGDVLRVGLARTRLRRGEESASTATLVGSLAVERALDFVVAVIVVAFAATAGVLPNGALHGRLAALAHPLELGAALAAAVAISAVAWSLRRRLTASWARLVRGLAVLRRPSRYLTCVASWQLLSWGLRFAGLVCFLYAFHVPSAIAVAPIVLSIQLLASAVPVTPGGAGTQQALLAAALGSAALVGFSAGAQLATALVDVGLGTLALASCGIRPRLRLVRAALVTGSF